jgi:hypothetical protein
MYTNITYTQKNDGRYEVTFTQHNTTGLMGITKWSIYFDTLVELKHRYPTAQPQQK